MLAVPQWSALARAHAVRADDLTAGHRSRRSAGQTHAIDDFIFTYYSLSPGRLRRWHPGVGTRLLSAQGHVPPQHSWRWYTSQQREANGAGDSIVHLDVARFLTDRGEAVRFVRDLLRATASRPPFPACFGLHEWAMVYRQAEHRHPLPLRLGQSGTDAVVEAHQIRCSHFDAFRFFTPAAVRLNRLQPTRAGQIAMEQPGCLHVTMDLYKWAYKMGPAVPGDLLLDCLALAQDARQLDMQASPYDVTGLGQPAVPIETAAGKAEYAMRQRVLTDRGAALRTRLLRVCDLLLDGGETAPQGNSQARLPARTHPADVV